MAHFTRALEDGPFVDAVFHISKPRANALSDRGVDLPRPLRGRALLDTGASHSCVDPVVTEHLGLEPRGQESMLTASTADETHTVLQFDLALFIPPRDSGDDPLALAALPMMHSRLLQFQGIHALIGRDVLSKCIFHYNGNGYFSLAW